MLAYHNDHSVKSKYLARVAAHRAADNLIQGTGWEGGKGCAVGCTLEDYRHARYETELGIPVQLAYLEDRLFEFQTPADAQHWPERFLSAIRPGADLSGVWGQWAVWMLVDEKWGVLQHARTNAARTAIRRVADLWLSGGTAEEFRQARSDAAAAACAADDDAARAAYAAAYDDDAAAAGAADAAYAGAGAADAAYAGAADARAAWVTAACDKLIALLEAA